jgi:large subunit ribosomal protein L22
MKAYLKNYRQSPRKVRLVANLIKGKSAERALLILDTTPKRATRQLGTLLKSAIANAKSKDGIAATDLFIKEIRVDKGLTMHRFMPKAQGRATRFDKHSSNVILTLGTAAASKKAVAEKKEAVKEKTKTTIAKTTKKLSAKS